MSIGWQKKKNAQWRARAISVQITRSQEKFRNVSKKGGGGGIRSHQLIADACVFDERVDAPSTP
jgi:hypothetical protein